MKRKNGRGFVNFELEDRSRDKFERGMSEKLFNNFYKNFKDDEEVLILTWGGPERQALTHWLKLYGVKGAKVLDLEKVIDIIFPFSSLKKISDILGVTGKSNKAKIDARAIYEIYTSMVRVDLTVKYSIDIFRVGKFLKVKGYRDIYNYKYMYDCGLGRLHHYIEKVRLQRKEAVNEEEWYIEHRRKLIERYNETSFNNPKFCTELHRTAVYYRSTGTLLPRYRVLGEFFNYKYGNPKDNSDIARFRAKAGEELFSNKHTGYYQSMYDNELKNMAFKKDGILV